MNMKEWKEFCKVDKRAAYIWYNKTRKKLLSKEFEFDDRTDKDANVIHHLRDTEEQRKYNDEHYEMFGFEVDEYGNEHFEYGKYVVFWTKEHHNEYHNHSEETKKKLSLAHKGRHLGEMPEDVKRKISNSLRGNKCHLGHHHSSETKNLLSTIAKQQSKQRIALVRAAYIDYKANSGSLSWNEFQRYYKHLDDHAGDIYESV